MNDKSGNGTSNPSMSMENEGSVSQGDQLKGEMRSKSRKDS